MSVVFMVYTQCCIREAKSQVNNRVNTVLKVSTSLRREFPAKRKSHQNRLISLRKDVWLCYIVVGTRRNAVRDVFCFFSSCCHFNVISVFMSLIIIIHSKHRARFTKSFNELRLCINIPLQLPNKRWREYCLTQHKLALSSQK